MSCSASKVRTRFMVYQMDMKSAFLYGRIEEEVYVCQPPGFEDPNYPDKVYMMVKALYGSHQAPRAWYETLSKYLLDIGFHRGKIDQTLFIKKQKGDILLVHVYVDDIIFSSTKKELCIEFKRLMHDKFQMSSIGELTFFLGLQVKQKEDGIFISQDKYVADILRKFSFIDFRTGSTPMNTKNHVLKDSDGDDVDFHLYRLMIGSLMYLTSSRPDIMFAVCACARFQVTPKLGLWYPRDSSFDLVAYSDRNYAGANLDRKSTIGGYQFLGCRLISWQCKKQTVVATSSTKAKYVAAAITDETVTKEWEDRMERVATTASSLEAEQASGNIIRTQSMATLNEPSPQGTSSGSGPRYALTENPTIYVSLIQQFWQTAIASTLDNEEMEISATIDGKVKILTKASVKRHLKLEDSDGISNLPTTEIFEQLAVMGNMKRTSKGYTGVDIPLFPTMLIHGPIFQGEGSTVQFDSHHTPTGASLTSQPHLSPTLRSSIRQETEVPRPSSPLHTNVADEAASIGVDVTPPKMCHSRNVSGGVTS
ncbi:putative ribonuclease H-like domain-containing protein [Tanacetum coccineum]